MKKTSASFAVDWSRLKGMLWLFGVALLLFGGAGLWLRLDLARLEERTADARQRLVQAQESYRREVESTRLADQYRDAWKLLASSGFLDEPDRITLVEQLNRYRKERAVPTLTYRFEPERSLEDYDGVAPQLHEISTSEQKLTFSLHDETELAGMLQVLEEAGQGFYLVERCELSRTDERLYLAFPGNVQGQCLLRWLTVDAKENKGDES